MYLLLCFYDQSGDHSEIIKHMARLVDSIEVPAAKAAILWVMGEYCERVPKIAPDVLRKMAKTFTNEDPAVKMQVNEDEFEIDPPQKHLRFIENPSRRSTWPRSCV